MRILLVDDKTNLSDVLIALESIEAKPECFTLKLDPAAASDLQSLLTPKRQLPGPKAEVARPSSLPPRPLKILPTKSRR